MNITNSQPNFKGAYVKQAGMLKVANKYYDAVVVGLSGAEKNAFKNAINKDSEVIFAIHEKMPEQVFITVKNVLNNLSNTPSEKLLYMKKVLGLAKKSFNTKEAKKYYDDEFLNRSIDQQRPQETLFKEFKEDAISLIEVIQEQLTIKFN